MVHQSNAYFERCHGADFNAQITPAAKRQCWGLWLRYYADEQSPDRVAYARDRFAALGRGEIMIGLPGVPTSAVDTAYTSSFLTVSEVDTTTDATDATGPAGPDPSSTDHHRRITPPIANGPCAGVCGPRLEACVARCEGRERSCQAACDIEQRTCARGCY